MAAEMTKAPLWSSPAVGGGHLWGSWEERAVYGAGVVVVGAGDPEGGQHRSWGVKKRGWRGRPGEGAGPGAVRVCRR